jgi:hypothetical protein
MVSDFVRQKLTRNTASGRAALDRRTVHIIDVLEDPEYVNKDGARTEGLRTILSLPLVKEEQLVGVMSLSRARR